MGVIIIALSSDKMPKIILTGRLRHVQLGEVGLRVTFIFTFLTVSTTN